MLFSTFHLLPFHSYLRINAVAHRLSIRPFEGLGTAIRAGISKLNSSIKKYKTQVYK